MVPASLGREVGKGSIITKAKRLKKKPFLHFTCKQSSSTPGLGRLGAWLPIPLSLSLSLSLSFYLSLPHGGSIFVRLSS